MAPHVTDDSVVDVGDVRYPTECAVCGGYVTEDQDSTDMLYMGWCNGCGRGIYIMNEDMYEMASKAVSEPAKSPTSMR
jgi:hypothetical protein